MPSLKRMLRKARRAVFRGQSRETPLLIAINPDGEAAEGAAQAFSRRWTTLACKMGHRTREVDLYAGDVLEQLAGCDGLMWRFGYRTRPRQLARRVLPAIEAGLGIPVFPSRETAWHFEDKLAQHYLLQAGGIATPRTWVFWHKHRAMEFAEAAEYPFVLKLAPGLQSRNVRLIRDFAEARFWIRKLFGPGTVSLDPTASVTPEALMASDLQQGYLLAQEFLPGNAFDTRITVVGERAFAFRRFNRPDDFRASGSGIIDWDPQAVDAAMLRLGLRIARRLRTQSVAVDGLYRAGEPLASEISYTYLPAPIANCPGHWRLRGDPESGSLEWVTGAMRVEDAILRDFVKEIRARKTQRN